jgi:hypothetical protein
MAFDPLRYPMTFAKPRYLSGESAWAGHIPFAWTLIEMMRPRVIVELGSYFGDSYCAMCQAVAELKLPCRCTAVDTWRGDEQTGAYPDQIFERLRAVHDPAFGAFSTLLRATFDEAAGRCADGSIDLLHIDGLHTYEAVRHDFETWRPKLSRRGVVLMHDTAARFAGFGVWQFWAEMEKQFPSFGFEHTHGLGVLAVGEEVEPQVLEFLQEARRRPQVVDAYFNALGQQMTMAGHVLRWHPPLEQALSLVAQWRQLTGRKPPYTFGPDSRFHHLGALALTDVQELLRACNPPPAGVSSPPTT